MARTPSFRLACGLVSASIALTTAACGPTDSGGTGLTGSIAVDGSSTVAPVSEGIAEEFRRVEPGVRVAVGTSGTGGGFKKFCSGELDIADASRPIKDEEHEECAKHGVEFTELRVGLDGLAIVTSAKNRFLECLSKEQLAIIFEDGGATRWDEVDPEFPEKPIDIFAPGTDSGTFDYFVEEVLGDPKKPDSRRPRNDHTASEDDNTLVQGIQGEQNSWGFFGFGYYKENQEGLKALAVAEETGGTCVTPTDASVENGSYPLSRPLFIYVKNDELARPEMVSFLDFYLDVTPEIIGEIGYTPVPEADYEAAARKLAAAVAEETPS